jgi:hypothetical protein
MPAKTTPALSAYGSRPASATPARPTPAKTHKSGPRRLTARRSARSGRPAGGRAGSLLILCSCRSPLPQAVGDSGTPQPEPPSCHSPSSQAAADSGTPQPEPPSCHSPSSQAAGDSGTPQPETAGELAALSERLRQQYRVVQKFERTAPRRSSALCRALIKQMRHAVLPGSAVGYLMGVVRGGTPLTSRHWLSQRRVTARA